MSCERTTINPENLDFIVPKEIMTPDAYQITDISQQTAVSVQTLLPEFDLQLSNQAGVDQLLINPHLISYFKNDPEGLNLLAGLLKKYSAPEDAARRDHLFKSLSLFLDSTFFLKEWEDFFDNNFLQKLKHFRQQKIKELLQELNTSGIWFVAFQKLSELEVYQNVVFKKIQKIAQELEKINPDQAEKITALRVQAQEILLSSELPVIPEELKTKIIQDYRDFCAPVETFDPQKILDEIQGEWTRIQSLSGKERGTAIGRFHKRFVYDREQKLQAFGWKLNRRKTKQGFEFSLEQLWEKMPDLQVPLGIGYHPQRVEEKHAFKSPGIFGILVQAEREAQQTGQRIKIHIFDCQESNHRNLLESRAYLEELMSVFEKNLPEFCQRVKIPFAELEQYLPGSVQDFQQKIKNENPEQKKQTLILMADLVSRVVGQRDAQYIRNITRSYNLQHLEIETWHEVSKNPLYCELKTVLNTIIDNDAGLQKKLLKTVDARFRTKAGIDRGPGFDNPANRDQILRDLAEYGLKVIALHIYNLGQTVVHVNEKKNYSLTQDILRNKKYLEQLTQVFMKHQPEKSSEKISKQLQNLGFVAPAYFQGRSLDPNLESPEEYKVYRGNSPAEIILEADKILVVPGNERGSENHPLTWVNYLTAHPDKQIEFLENVIAPQLIGHFYFTEDWPYSPFWSDEDQADGEAEWRRQELENWQSAQMEESELIAFEEQMKMIKTWPDLFAVLNRSVFRRILGGMKGVNDNDAVGACVRGPLVGAPTTPTSTEGAVT